MSQDAQQLLETDKSTPVELFLQSKNILFSTLATSAAPVEQVLQVVILQANNQPVAAIFPRSRILDLQQLERLTGNSYQVDNQLSLELVNNLDVAELPALPELLDLPCIHCTSINQQLVSYSESDQEGQLIELTPTAVQQLLADSKALGFSCQITDCNPNLKPNPLEQASLGEAVLSLTNKRIKQQLEKTVEIPPLSATAQKVLKLRANPDACVDELTAIIETDPAMAAQVMSWASSPYYAAPGKVRSIEDAIVRVLGFDLVINLALGLALGKTLQLPKSMHNQNRDYWRQAIYAAALIEGLVRATPRVQRPEPGIAYLSGLLHSFGYILLAHVFPPYFQLVNKHLDANPHLRSYHVEHYLLGITREQMGTWLMQHWQMPSELVIAIGQQTNPNYCGQHEVYAKLLWLTNYLLGKAESPDTNKLTELYQQLGIEPQAAQKALDNVLNAEKALRQLATQFAG